MQRLNSSNVNVVTEVTPGNMENIGESCHKYYFCRDKSFLVRNLCLS